jgi:hypothetical protein
VVLVAYASSLVIGTQNFDAILVSFVLVSNFSATLDSKSHPVRDKLAIVEKKTFFRRWSVPFGFGRVFHKRKCAFSKISGSRAMRYSQ